MGRKRKGNQNSSRNTKSRVLTKHEKLENKARIQRIKEEEEKKQFDEAERKRILKLCQPNPCTVVNIFRAKLPTDLGLKIVNFADNYSKRCKYCNFVCNNGQALYECDECEELFHEQCMPDLAILDNTYYLCASCVEDPTICETCKTYALIDCRFSCAECSRIYHRDCCYEKYDASTTHEIIEICDICVNEFKQVCADCKKDVSDYYIEECNDCDNVVCDNCRKRGLCQACYKILKDEKNERRDELEKALLDMGLELRLDSKMCSKYIDESEDNSLEEVVQLMCGAKLFHEYCEWDKFYEKEQEKYDETLNAGYFPDSPVWEEVECLLSSCVPKDGKWPWLHGISVEEFRKSDKYQCCLRRNGLQ